MKVKLLLFVVSFLLVTGLLTTGSGLAYYYPSTGNIPPGPPPNYNQVDTTYFLGTPELPLPPPDTGGLFLYYDQGTWCVANHIYSKGNSLEQFHCGVLAVISQPPTLGVNVFMEEFEFWGDTTVALCLKQNDRWGWIPWGDDLYEIWWDVNTREWKQGEGDPNDFMCFRISGCAIDFNFWSSDHEGTPFGPDQIYLGANKTPLSLIPGFTDTYPGIDDPYQSQAGGDPTEDPNVTIFTLKNDTLRSYNKNGLIDSTDSYSCNLAVDYGERYAGTFAYEGNGVQFSTSNLCPPNRNPNIMITPDTSVFVCTEDSVMIWIFASDPDVDDTITVEKIYGMGIYQPQTDLTPIYDEFYFHPDTSGVYAFIFRVTDDQGLTDEDTSLVTVQLNRPPELTCPDDDSVHAGESFSSTIFSATDPDGETPLANFLDIIPSATNDPYTFENHVEWLTTCNEDGDYTIRLVASDDCETKDTCSFVVTVYNRPPELTCPADDTVLAGDLFISTDFSVTDPDGDATPVTVLDITPSVTNDPTIVGNHVEWGTTSNEFGDYVIRLVATDPCGRTDTCDFTITVSKLPPVLTCPPDDSCHAGNYFVSGEFSVDDPKFKQALVTVCGIDPSAPNTPFVVSSHVEWQTECVDAGKVFAICLEATDTYGAKDSCSFNVTVYNRPPELACPDDGVINAGLTFVSNDFSATDPDGDPVLVSFLNISPSATNDPQVVNSHVEWVTTLSELGDYIVRLIATDPCGLADTCDFLVTVDEPTGDFLCPDDDSVHAGDLFISTDFTLTYPECDPSSVEVLDVDRPVMSMPTIVGYHVEWQTSCEEDGDYIIRLRTNESCSIEDTCSFTVTVYNRPPELTCPDYGTVEPMQLFISTDFHFTDPDGDDVLVSLLGIDPPAEYDPVIVEHHVEWQTTCVFGDYIITLVATDPCGLADTCEFMVTLSFDPVPNFYIWVYPITAYVSQGNSVGYLVELNSMNGYHKPCSLFVSGLPNPPNSAVFDQPVMTPTEFTTMTVYTLPQTDTGTYTLTVTGKEIGGVMAHKKQVYLRVLDSQNPLDVDDDADNANLPKTFTLFQNQPNPFNPETRISYSLPRDCRVRVIIYNLLGQRVKLLFEGYQTTGTHTLTWNGRSDRGNQLSTGIYFYQLQADRFVETKKMTLIK